MKTLLTALILTLSFTASAVDNNLMFQLQQQSNQQQIINEMRNMRDEQERANRLRNREYNNYQWEQQQNRMYKIIQQLNHPQSYAMPPVNSLSEQILFGR